MNNTTFESGSSHLFMNNLIFAILLLLIPLIMVPSIFVVCAVILLKKLHTPQNVILLTISVYDCFIAGVVIPIRMMVDVLDIRKTLYTMTYFCLALDMIADCIEDSSLVFVALLALDTFIQIKYPLKYPSLYSVRQMIRYIISIIIGNVCFIFLIFGLRYWAQDDCKTTENVGQRAKSVKGVYLTSLSCYYALCLIFCLMFGIYARCIAFKVEKSGKMVMWLSLLYVVFYIPIMLSFYGLIKADDSKARWLRIIPELIRHMSCITNLTLIYNFRPNYRFAFKFFLKNHPKHWKEIEAAFNARSESKPTSVYAEVSKRSVFESHTNGRDINSLANENMNMKSKESIDASESSRAASVIHLLKSATNSVPQIL